MPESGLLEGAIYASECATGDLQYVPSAVAWPELPGHFYCGGRYCKIGEELCVKATGFSNASRCLSLPDSCIEAQTCDCLDPQQLYCWSPRSPSNARMTCADAGGSLILSVNIP